MRATDETTGPFHAAADGLKVAVRLQPGASRAGIDGLAELADGRVVLKARVGAPPEGGKANAALIKLLAKAWGLPKTTFSIASGHGQREKLLLIAGDPTQLQARIETLLDGSGR